MDLSIFDKFQLIVILILIEAQIFPPLASGRLFSGLLHPLRLKEAPGL